MSLTDVENETFKTLLFDFIKNYNTPAFGSLPKREIDILVFQLMQELGLISENPSTFELVEKLHITRTRAYSLLYDSNLRKFDKEKLEVGVRQMLEHPVAKRGDAKHIYFQIENPVLADYIRHKLSKTGYAVDGSFSPTLIVLSHEMLALLLEEYFTLVDKQAIAQKLSLAGYPHITFRKVLAGILSHLGQKIAGDIGGELIGSLIQQVNSFVLTSDEKRVLSIINEVTIIKKEPAK